MALGPVVSFADAGFVNFIAGAVAAGLMAGVNLAGAEFAKETVPGTVDVNYIWPKNQSVSYYHSKGMNICRLPFLWERIQPALGGALDATYAGELDRLVTACTAGGRRAIIDVHNYMRRYVGGTPFIVGETTTVTSAHFSDLWTRLANRYKNNSGVVFCLMNEPHDQDMNILVNALNGAIAAIRATGASNMIHVCGNHYSGAHSWTTTGPTNAVAMLNIVDSGNNFAFDMHQYLDVDSAGFESVCTVGAGSSRLVSATNWLRTNNRRAFLGEFNCGENEQCYTELRALLTYIANNRDVWLGWTYWAGGPGWPKVDQFSIEPVDLAAPVDEPQMTLMVPYFPAATAVSANYLLAEDGSRILTEAGDPIILESA